MTREYIEDFREIVLPFVKKMLLEINYDNLGEADAKKFERTFNEILNLAIKALEQEPITKNDSPKYCDRNICLKNEYNNTGCEDCEVTKNQEPTQSPIIDWNNCHTPEQLENIATAKNDSRVDCISREDALMCLTGEFEDRQYEPSELVSIFSKRIKHLPSATPQSRCKDCKWWKDSDGEYRRGCGAESICHINTVKVYQGEGYCYLFEPNILER